MKTKFAFLCFLALGVSSALAQSQSVQQSGSVTAGHIPSWVYNGVVQDSGTSTNPKATTFGLYGTGTPFCIENTNVYTGPYYQFCLGYATGSSAAVISLAPFGGAPNIPLNLVINGVNYSIGGSGNWLSPIFDQLFGSTPGDMLCRGSSAWVALAPGATGQILATQGTTGCPQWVTPGSVFTLPLRTVATGATDTASSTDGTIAWNSATASSKTQNIYACNSGVAGRALTIKDEKGNAGTYAISVLPSAGTIENGSIWYLSFNLQSVTVQCDGSTSNWIITGSVN